MSPVLTFVEGSEFRKETARILARKLVEQAGVGTLIAGGGSVVDDLLAALTEDLSGLSGQALRAAIQHAAEVGFSGVSTAEAEATMEAAIARVVAAVRGQLQTRLDELAASVDAMVAGSSEDAVRTALATSSVSEALLAPVSSLLAQTGAGIVQAVEADVANEAVAQHEEAARANASPDEQPTLYEWEARLDGNECGQDEVFEVSCAARHGQQLSFDEWQAFGMPGDPDAPTICAIYAGSGRSFCRCRIRPADAAGASPSPIRIEDAAKAGRDRAAKEAA